jgi:rSAM/selenodomain-associated transferase 2
MLDIIIPVFNEEEILKEREGYFFALKAKANLIFVDGGSSDATQEIAQRYGNVYCSDLLGRGPQKNFGARKSSSNMLLFLHVDTVIPEESILNIKQIINTQTSAGCFSLSIQEQGAIFRIFEWLLNFRAKVFGIVDGDMGLFIHREKFFEAGMFLDWKCMEDIEFSKRLRKLVKVKVLPDSIKVSSRKWQEQGFWKVFAQYARFYFHYWFGGTFECF